MSVSVSISKRNTRPNESGRWQPHLLAVGANDQIADAAYMPFRKVGEEKMYDSQRTGDGRLHRLPLVLDGNTRMIICSSTELARGGRGPEGTAQCTEAKC